MQLGFESVSFFQPFRFYQQVLLVYPGCLAALVLRFTAPCVLADALLVSAGSTSLLCSQDLQANLRILLV